MVAPQRPQRPRDADERDKKLVAAIEYLIGEHVDACEFWNQCNCRNCVLMTAAEGVAAAVFLAARAKALGHPAMFEEFRAFVLSMREKYPGGGMPPDDKKGDKKEG